MGGNIESHSHRRKNCSIPELNELKKLSVLYFGKDAGLETAASKELKRHFKRAVVLDTVKNKKDFKDCISNRRYHIVLCEYPTQHNGIIEVLTLALKLCPKAPVILLGNSTKLKQAEKFLIKGASDYIYQDRLDELPLAVIRAMRSKEAMLEKERAEKELALMRLRRDEAQRVNHIGNIVYYTGDERLIASPEAMRILGLKEEKTRISLGRLLKAVDEQDRERITESWKAAVSTLGMIDEEFRLSNPVGHRWLHLCMQIKREEHTSAVTAVGMVRDITTARETELEANRHANFERSVMALSRKFINTPQERLDEAICDALRCVGEYCEARWAAVYRFDRDNTAAERMYEWRDERCTDTVSPLKLPAGTLDAARETCGAFCIIPTKTYSGRYPLCAYPIMMEGQVWGALVCDTGLSHRPCGENAMVCLFCDMLIAVLRRSEGERAFREASESNRLIMDSIEDGFCTLREDGTIINIGRSFAARFEKTVQECIGLRISDLLPEDRYGGLAERRMNILKQTYETGQRAEFEDSRDGRWFNNRFYPVYKGDKVIAVSLFSTDITNKKKADEEYNEILMLEKEAQLLREREQEYLEILDGSTVGSWIFEVQNGIMRYSSQWQKRLGIKGDATGPIENYYESIMHPDDKDYAIAECDRLLKSGALKYKIEYRLKSANNGYIWVLAQGKVIYDGKTPVKIFGTSIDITERKRAEEALRENRALLSMIIEGVSDIIYLKDTDNRFVLANPAMSRFFGIPEEEIIGRSLADLLEDKEAARRIEENDCSIIETGRKETLEEKIGTQVFLAEKAPWRNADGKVIGLFGISRDITRMVEMMQTLRTTAEEIKIKNQLITDFFINISHEFKTPISIMMISAEMIEQDLGGIVPNIKNAVCNMSYIRQNINRLNRLVNNLLDITKIDAGFMQPTLISRDIASMLRYLVASLQPYAKKMDVTITYKGPDEGVMIPTDMVVIDRIILNLVSNALKHTQRGGCIEVRCKAFRDSVRMAVIDNGEGIPKDKLDIIFDRFRQVNTTLARSHEGCGIGLALVRSLVQMLGGQIWVISEQGSGSRFIAELPRKQETGGPTIEVDGLMLDKRIEMELSDIVSV